MKFIFGRQNIRIVLTLQVLLSVGFLFSQSDIQQQRQKIDQLNTSVWEKVKNHDDSSRLVLNQSVYLSKKINYAKGLAKAYKNFGVYFVRNGSHEVAQQYYFNALKIYDSLRNNDEIALCYNNIANIFSRIGNFEKSIAYYKLALKIHLKNGKFKQYAETSNNLAGDLIAISKLDEAKRQVQKGLLYVDSINDPIIYANLLLNLAIINFDENQLDDGINCLKKIITIYEEKNFQEGLSATYYHLGLFSDKKNDYQQALHFYRKSYQIGIANKLYDNIRAPLEAMIYSYNHLGEKDSVSHYFTKLIEFNEEIQLRRSAKNIQEIEIKFQTEKKEQQLMLEKEKRAKLEAISASKNKTITILVICIVLIVVSSIFVWVFQKQKQQLIAVKLNQKNDEVEKIIAEQRIKIIESQLNGEVSERLRIASELHDRVGGLLATLNLQFEVLEEKCKLKDEGKLIKQLLKSTINEVRKISHNLDGVGESSGLEHALNQLQEGISSSQKIEMHLYYELGDIILSNRMESELFSIIQELTTNTLKHANASNITVQLSLLDEKINLIFEDDGAGFNVQTTNLGIGLKNIEKRVEKLNGTFIIDSKPNRGSTLIANIPFE